jgi:porphobilinogen synthase
MIIGQFPNSRLRRTRKFSWSRNLIRENNLTINDFIWAVFVCEGENIKQESPSMPKVYIYSIDRLIIELEKFVKNGLNAVMLFPKIDLQKKSQLADEALNPDNLICRTIKEIKKNYSDLGVTTDIALDPYTLNGHDGITDNNEYVLNDKTVEILCNQALNFAKAGCDIVAPSDMMDGRIGQIRQFLDIYGFQDVQIMSYSVKFCSSFYGAFRSSIGSQQKKPIDKSTYQIDFFNSNEALKEIEQDIDEGADQIIIKPAILYLDIIRQAKDNFNIPIVAYNVSSEYSMMMNAAQNNIFNRHAIFHETFASIKRAGANIIITYNMEIVLEILNNKKS